MYTSYWKLRERPFDDSGDARFFYTTEAVAAATLKLRYALGNRQHGIVLCGPSGVGKTALLARVHPITGTAPGEPVTAVVPFPEMPVPELLAEIAWRIERASETCRNDANSLAGAMERPESATADDAAVTPPVRRSVQRIERVLARNTAHGRTTLLVIEESHRLAPPVFETLRQLLNLDATTSGAKHLSTDELPSTSKAAAGGGLFLILSGQPALLPMLARIPALEERLAGRALLPPLTVEETISYVSHRLHAAGAAENPFDTEAMETLHRVSGGIPRRINRIADMALLLGFAEELERPDAEHVQAVADDATFNPAATLPLTGGN